MSVTQRLLPFKLILDTESSIVTSFAGLPLVVETMRALGLPVLVKKFLKVKQRDTGKYSEGDYVESFVSLFASGGECLDDFDRLRLDRGLTELGLKIPSPESGRFFLYSFHDEGALEARPLKGAFVPPETERLGALFKVQEGIISRAAQGDSPRVATIDQDALVIESNKEEAKPTYLGHDGYQPLINYWAEKDLILKDEFRDGNVPSSYDCLSSLKASIEMLPDSVAEVRFRADSSAYNHELMDRLREGIEVKGRKVRVRYAISAPMTDTLRTEIEKLTEDSWRPLRKLTDKGPVVGRKEWAEVVFAPSKGSRKKGKAPDRYLAIRVSPAQGELFSDGNRYHYYAVVSNIWEWDGEGLLWWHRERCGTIEKVHDVLKNDLAGGVMPCGRFYSNAAWWRLNCIAYNVISIMKRKALPQSWWKVRMKALRFWLIGVAGRLIRRSRQLYLRFSGLASTFTIYLEARRRLFEFAKGT